MGGIRTAEGEPTPERINPRKGRIEVICGSMFCGKSEELIERVKRATRYEKKRTQVFKPALDSRRGASTVNTENGNEWPALSVDSSGEILESLTPGVEVVAIDEAQFFDMGLVKVCKKLAKNGIRVIVAGLDLDFRGENFGPVPDLIARAQRITKLYAVCEVCGRKATRTQRLINGKPANFDDPIIFLGAKQSYQSRCLHCHEVPGHPDEE